MVSKLMLEIMRSTAASVENYTEFIEETRGRMREREHNRRKKERSERILGCFRDNLIEERLSWAGGGCVVQIQ